MRAGIPQVLAKTTTHLLQPIHITSGILTSSALLTLAFPLTSLAPLTPVVLHHYSSQLISWVTVRSTFSKPQSIGTLFLGRQHYARNEAISPQ